MIFRHSAGDSIRDNGSPKQSRSERKYSRFFEGFDEKVIPNKSGKGYRVKHIYTADYYMQELTDRNRAILRICYVLGFFILCALFGSSAISKVISNRTWYVTIFQAICVALLQWLLVALFYYVPSGKFMTAHIYRSMTKHFRRSTFALGCGFAALAIADFVCVAINSGTFGWGSLVYTVKYLICALVSVALYIIERKIIYSTVANPDGPKKSL